MCALAIVSGQRVKVPRPRDGQQVRASAVSDWVLASTCGKVDQRPQVGGSGELECLHGIPATALAVRRQDGVRVRRHAVETHEIAEVGERMTRVSEMYH